MLIMCLLGVHFPLGYSCSHQASGFYPVWARFCLENTDPRTRGRGIQLLSQVLLECHSLLQEKEGKGCCEFWSDCVRAGGQPVP